MKKIVGILSAVSLMLMLSACMDSAPSDDSTTPDAGTSNNTETGGEEPTTKITEGISESGTYTVTINGSTQTLHSYKTGKAGYDHYTDATATFRNDADGVLVKINAGEHYKDPTLNDNSWLSISFKLSALTTGTFTTDASKSPSIAFYPGGPAISTPTYKTTYPDYDSFHDLNFEITTATKDNNVIHLIGSIPNQLVYDIKTGDEYNITVTFDVNLLDVNKL